jgi:hypothetical protein
VVGGGSAVVPGATDDEVAGVLVGDSTGDESESETVVGGTERAAVVVGGALVVAFGCSEVALALPGV